MKKATLCFFSLFLFAISLSACQKSSEQTASTTVSTEICVESTMPVTVPSPPEATIPTEPPHSDLYISGVSVEDVILYFNEVCLQAEFVNSGNPTKLQKWTSPIYYSLTGDYTEEDYATLTGFAESLNAIYGFPGMYESPDGVMTNLYIYFCSEEEMVGLLGDNFWGMDGAVTFWYDNEDAIYSATICYRKDLDQYLRNSVILEEIYNGLGPIQDTSLRSDSIIYSAFSELQCLTDVDWLLLKLLYHPQLQCGMDATACEAVIRDLYY